MLNLSTGEIVPDGTGTPSRPGALSGNWVAKLQRFVSSRPAPPEAAPPELASAQVELCDLCGVRIPSEHAHLLDLSSRQTVCACQACATVVGARTDGRFRSLPDRAQALPGFRITDAEWASLQIPIDLAFLFHSTPEGRLVALYPGPAGATESRLHPEDWAAIVEGNPALADMEPDVEALLVNRIRGRREYFRVPIDRCFVLVALIRTHWQGISGGDEVWAVIDDFFARLAEPQSASRSWAHG